MGYITLGLGHMLHLGTSWSPVLKQLGKPNVLPTTWGRPRFQNGYGSFTLTWRTWCEITSIRVDFKQLQLIGNILGPGLEHTKH